jgi:hypothetical protein
MPVIPATWEAEIGRITVRGQPWANSSQDPISKITSASWAEVWLKQVQSPGSNPSRTKKKKSKCSLHPGTIMDALYFYFCLKTQLQGPNQARLETPVS